VNYDVSFNPGKEIIRIIGYGNSYLLAKSFTISSFAMSTAPTIQVPESRKEETTFYSRGAHTWQIVP